VTDTNFQTPRTFSSAIAFEREIGTAYSVLVKYNYAKTTHLTRFVNRNDALLGSPWSSGLNGTANGIGTLTVVESSAKSNYSGVTVGLRAATAVISASAQLHPVLGQVRRRQRARSLRSATRRSRTSTPSTAAPTATSATA
jgi:hypothetical protein